MFLFRLLFLKLILFICCENIIAQQSSYNFKIILLDGNEALLKKIKTPKKINGILEAQQQLQKLLFQIYDKGYLTASIDSIAENENSIEAFLNIGKQYEWMKLKPGNIEKALFNDVDFKEKLYSDNIFNYKDVSKLCNKILSELENNGYPFAVVRLDSINIQEEKISASLWVEKNQIYRYDTIALSGTSKISKYYLVNYLGIKPNGLYDENTVSKIDTRLRQLPFLNAEKPAEILFTDDKARPSLVLNSRKASQFDFLVGFLPNNAETGKLLITGEANINMTSALGFGENFRLNWRKLQARTQNLDVGFAFPYIISLPFGIDASLKLYKKDTLFLDVNWDAGISYMFVGGNYFKAFINNQFSNALNIDTTQIIINRRLPEYSDSRKFLYGLEYYFERLNYRFNPTSGFIVKLRGAAGTRKIKPNQTIINIKDPENVGQTFATLYDSLQLNSIQYKIDYRLEKYWQLAKRSTVKTAAVGGAIIANQVFTNEMYRLGGTKILRGFDEESIFASQFHVLTVEYRFLLAQNSFFNVFFDGAYVQTKNIEIKTNDFPYGFGAGLAFASKAGIFSLSYAIGSQQGNPVNFRSAKIHFGYVNLF